MANKISSEDLFEGKLFESLITQITEAEKKLEGLSTNLKSVGESFKSALGELNTKNLNDINEILKKNKEIEKSLQSQFELEKEQLKLKAQKEKLEVQLEAIKKKYAQEEQARTEKLNKNTINSTDAFKKLEAQYKNVIEETKRLGAEMLNLEKAGKQNTQAYKDLQEQHNKNIKSAHDLEVELKNITNPTKKKNVDNLNDAYKRLEQNTRELKNESKRLGAEMLELEQAGKKNTKAYYDLENQYKRVTKSAQEGDKQLKKLDSTVGDSFRNVGSYGKALGGFKQLLEKMGLAFGIYQVYQFGKTAYETQIKLDSLKLALKNVSDGTIEYQRNLSFVVNMSRQYGQDLVTITETYKNFIGATKNSNLALGERQLIFQSLIKSTSALGMSNEDVEGTLRAVQQMFAKGKVQAEELTQQLGDRLPNATQIMAKAVGVSTAELYKMMKNGELLTDDIFPRFAYIIEEEVGKNATEKLKTISGATNLLKTNFALYVNDLLNSKGTFKWFASAIVGIANNLKGLLNTLGSALRYWAEYKLALVVVNTAQTIFNGGAKQLIMNLLGISSKVADITDEAQKSAKAMSLLKGAIAGIGVGVLAEVVYQLYRIASGAEVAEDAMNKLNYQTQKGSQVTLNIIQKGYKKYYDEVAKLQNDLRNKKITPDQFQSGKKNAQQSLSEFLKSNKEEVKRRREEYEMEYKLLLKSQKEMLSGVSKEFPTFTPEDLRESFFRQTTNIGTKYGMNVSPTLKPETQAYGIINQLKANIQALYDAEKTYNQEAVKVTQNMGKKAKATDGLKRPYMEHIREVADLNMEYKDLNELLDEHLRILQEINYEESKRRAEKISKGTEKTLSDVHDTTQTTGRFEEQAIRDAIKAETDAMIKAEEERYSSLKGKFNEKASAENRKELADLEAQREDKQRRLDEMQSDIDRYKEELRTNWSKEGKSANQIEKLLSQNKFIIQSEDKLKQYRKKNNKEYDEKQKELIARFKTRNENAKAEELKLETEHQNNLSDITENAVEKTNENIKQGLAEQAEYNLNMIKKLANSTNELIQMGMDTYMKTLERNISMIEDRMNRLNQNIDYLQQKAVEGNISAQESLAKAQKDQLDAEKEKANFQRTIQRMQLAMTVFNAYNSNIQNAKVGENPFTKTITDISALTAFVGSLPTFYEGTETTIADALGNPMMQGKDGYVVRVDGSEKVLNPYLSAKTGNLTTRDIAQIAEDRLKGKLVYGSEINSTANNMWASMQLIDEIQDLKSIIKNKPETNIAMGEIVGGVMKIVETTKVANTTTRNIHRFNKKI